jgi:hypothetical protein
MLQIPAILTTAQEGQQRSTCHELRGRLGLHEERTPSDLRERMLWVLPQLTYGGSAWALYYAFHYVDKRDQEATPDSPARYRGLAALVTLQVKGLAYKDYLDWLPKRGARDRSEPWLAWVGREFDKFIRATISHQLVVENPDFTLRAFMDRAMVLHNNTTQIYDWVESTGENLYDYSLDEAIIAANTWHRQFSAGVDFRSPVEPAVLLASWPDGGHIDRLVTRRHLAAEGTSMGHCVGGQLDQNGIAPGDGHYWQEVRDDRSVILSYRDPQDVPQATVELTCGRRRDPIFSINQTQGPEDGEITDVPARARMAWFLMRVLNLPADSMNVRERLLHGSTDFSIDDTLDELDTDIGSNLRQTAEAIYEIINDALDVGDGVHIDPSRTLRPSTIEGIEDFVARARKMALAAVQELNRCLENTNSPLREIHGDCWEFFSPHLNVDVSIRWVQDVQLPPYPHHYIPLIFLGFQVSVPERTRRELLARDDISGELIPTQLARVTTLFGSLEANCCFIGIYPADIKEVGPDDQPGTLAEDFEQRMRARSKDLADR